MTSAVEPVAISVLIRTFNSTKTLDRVLTGLKLQRDEEFIVVDSGSTDSTLEIAQAHGARIIHAPAPFNYSKSLNLGFRAACNPWVHVISSHSISVVPDLLEVLRSAAREFPADVVVGYGPNTLNGRGFFDDDKVRLFSRREEFAHLPTLGGNGNALYRRSAWEAVPFNENIRTGEDKAWLAEVLDKGWHIAVISGARTINLSQYSLRYMFRKGYSDCLALPRDSMSVFDFIMAFASHTKKFLQGGMPVGNWIRYSAHIAGRFFASYRSQDNTPESK
jgi:glycosyltransferase involved in cell wall biosynthesis